MKIFPYPKTSAIRVHGLCTRNPEASDVTSIILVCFGEMK